MSFAVLKEAFTRFREQEMTDRAAALTYYSLMSLFPALLVGVALFGLLGELSTVDRVVDYLGDNGVDQTTLDAVRNVLDNSVEAGASVSLAFIGGLAVAMYGASGAFGAAGRALNHILCTDEERSFVKHKLADIGATLLLILLGLISIVLVFLGGQLAEDLFDEIGLGSTAATVWSIVRWPLAILVTMVIYAVVYYFAPDDTDRKWRWISPGAVIGVLIWIIASAGFFVYVDNFGSYNKTYGTFAGAVILLVWLWLTNVALLFGAEINAILDRHEDPHKDPATRAAVAVEEKVEDAVPG